MRKLLIIILSLVISSCSMPRKRTDKKSKAICESHVFAMNLNQLRKKIIDQEVKHYRKDRINNKQHPFYAYYYRYKKKDNKPIEQDYLFQKQRRSYGIDDPLIHFIEIDHDPNSFTIVTQNRAYFGTKIDFLKTRLLVKSFSNFIVDKKRINVQTGFSMGIQYIDFDKTLEKAQRDYAHELNLINLLEPNKYKEYFPN